MSDFNGVALASCAVGLGFIYAGVKGYSVPQVLQSVIQGKSPQTLAQSQPVGTPGGSSSSGSSGGSTPVSGGGGTDAQNKALGKQMAAAYGWGSGAEWSALNNIVMAESGWSDTVTNTSSGAAGIAQNINGWSSDYQKGNAAQQISWLLTYIKGRYGDPVAAWAFHQAHGSY